MLGAALQLLTDPRLPLWAGIPAGFTGILWLAALAWLVKRRDRTPKV